MTDLQFQVAKRRTQPITFTLGVEPGEKVTKEAEHVYSFTPPKTAMMMMPMLDAEDGMSDLEMTKATFDWLGEGLGKADMERIKKRLRDPKDGLDIDTLGEVIQGLSEKINGDRPST